MVCKMKIKKPDLYQWQHQTSRLEKSSCPWHPFPYLCRFVKETCELVRDDCTLAKREYSITYWEDHINFSLSHTISLSKYYVDHHTNNSVNTSNSSVNLKTKQKYKPHRIHFNWGMNWYFLFIMSIATEEMSTFIMSSYPSLTISSDMTTSTKDVTVKSM